MTVKPTSGVRQGDELSSVILNLVTEPLVRHGKAKSNAGFQLFNTRLKSTAYADDISVADSNPISLQSTIDGLIRTFSILGLRFNANKCYSLIITNGEASTSTNLSINGVHIFGHLSRGSTRTFLASPWASGSPLDRPQTSARR